MKENQTDIVIVDDDNVAGQLTKNLLLEAGFSAYLVKRSIDALPAIKRRRPRLVITDIMLNGLDGLKLCKILKNDPRLGAVKLVVVSQKGFEYEKHKAFEYGAQAFITKPYNVETFSAQINHIMTGSRDSLLAFRDSLREDEMSAEEPQPSDLQAGQIRVTFWGTRSMGGRVPDGNSSYGRQTPCVSVETSERTFIFDAGTGIYALGEKIMQQKGPRDLWLMLTHFHISHVLGLAGFQCLDHSMFTIRLSGAGESEKKFKDTVRELFYSSPYWPSRTPRAKLMMYEIIEDTYELAPDVRLSAVYANHPTTTLGFRLEICGRVFVYLPDGELTGKASSMENYDEKLAGFCHGADLLVHDACYSDSDYKAHTGEGHSGAGSVVKFAGARAGAKRLVLFNLHSSYQDEDIEIIEQQAARAAAKYDMECAVARDGMEIILESASAGADE
ncbi:MAG: response regulator [Elusimicrobiaceae bacterium]|nr:response regulator [Elusimicrobiaceae bacterium]